MSKCSFCRNEPAENEHQYEGDFVFVMCDDCNARYEDNKQLGPKFLICKCDPDNPKELDLSMGKEELETAKKQAMEIQDMGIDNDNKIVQDRSGLNKDKAFEVIHETSGYIPKDENDNKFKAKQEEYKNSRRRKKV